MILFDGIKKDQKIVVVGVSGGADSLFLLWRLKEAGFNLLCATYDHCLRPESGSEVDYVKNLCENWKIPFCSGKGNVSEYARNNRLSLEEAARKMRYSFLFSVAVNNDAQAVAVAHHADDQAETVFMHFLRGSGIEGLCGMRVSSLPNPWSASIPLVRPLLQIRRSEIDAWIEQAGLTPIVDQSNFSDLHFRNALRNEMIPLISQNYSPQFVPSLIRMSKVMQADLRIIDEAIESAWEKGILSVTGALVSFDRQAFVSTSAPIQARLIRKMALSLQSELRDLSFDLTRQALVFFDEARQNQRQSWFNGLSLFAEGETIGITSSVEPAPFSTDHPQLPSTWTELTLAEGMPVTIGNFEIERNHIRPELAQAEMKAGEMRSQGSIVWLDADQVHGDLTIRKCQIGERFAPLGMHGKKKKCSDFWIDRKLPRQYRANFPVIADAQEILWIPFHQVAHRTAVTDQTRNVIRVCIRILPQQNKK